MRLWLVLLGTLPLLAVGSGATASGSAAPQNGLIAVRGGEGIFIVDPRTETAALIPETQELSEPEWSPDGTRLAVTSWGDAGDSVYTMKPDGSERTLVLRNAYSPSWSPDGSLLVVVRDDETGSSLAIVSADGRYASPLEGTADASVPKWSPDGKRIAFVDANGKIGLISVPDGERLAVPAIASGGSVSWSPDSAKLAYDRYEGNDAAGREVVAVLDLASGKETVLPGGQNAAQTPVWSPEGDQIVFLSMGLDKTVTASCGSHVASHLWLMTPDGTKAHRIGKGYVGFGLASWGRAAVPAVATPPRPAPSTPVKAKATPRESVATPPLPAPSTSVKATPRESAPTPAPRVSAKTAKPVAAKKLKPLTGADGLIAVRGEKGIYLVDPSSRDTRKVPGTIEMTAPVWSPDMRLLAVQKIEKSGASVYTVRPDGTHPQLVMENASAPSWSADGKRILAVHGACPAPCDLEDDDAQVLYSARLDGSDVQRVDFEDADAYGSRELEWPTDGLASHFFDEESLIGPGNFDSLAATWSPRGAVLAFTDVATRTGLWLVSADGGKPELVLAGASGRPSWGPTSPAAGSQG
jgi:Tol biopolymer transport system component